MTTELQNKVWSILPKEFKEEVKEIYSNAIIYHPCGYNHKTDLLKYLFGRHNLTSDEEGEEMLTVSRKEVRSIYDHAIGLITKTRTEDENYKLAMLEKTLMEELFGSKCLPDELNEDNFAKSESKPSEPKNEGTRQEQYVPKNAESGTHSFDHILKEGFREHNRLHIAAMAMQGILSNADRMKGYEYVATEPPCGELAVVVARNALRYADALITEVEKKES